MQSKMDVEKAERIINNLAISEKISFKKHCIVRMIERGILADDIKKALSNLEIIKVYLDDRPLVSYLVLGFCESGKPLHLLVAINDEKTLLWIITVYKPDTKVWTSDYKERKVK